MKHMSGLFRLMCYWVSWKRYPFFPYQNIVKSIMVSVLLCFFFETASIMVSVNTKNCSYFIYQSFVFFLNLLMSNDILDPTASTWTASDYLVCYYRSKIDGCFFPYQVFLLSIWIISSFSIFSFSIWIISSLSIFSSCSRIRSRPCIANLWVVT